VEPYVEATEREEKMLVRIKSQKFHTLNRNSIAADKDILFSTSLFTTCITASSD
jgi:hypothetical protein